MTSIGWLHLSDFHQGMTHQGWLWPDAREMFFEDLARIHDRSGPWDLVLFTGDLTQTGSAQEFAAFEDTLGELWEHFAKLECQPEFVTVPGNHDLVRPPRLASRKIALSTWHDNEEIRSEFWDKPGNEYVEFVKATFAPYSGFWRRCRFRIKNAKEGILPGDVSATLERHGVRLGIIGLNSTFLQLSGADYNGKLDIDPRQLHAVCDGDAPKWLKNCDATLLLTHQPPEWLKHQDRFRRDIAPPGRFAAHLYGHIHAPSAISMAIAGSSTEHRLPGASLFGLHGTEERVYGYSAGRISIEGENITVRVWPRRAIPKHGGQFRMQADSDFTLGDDEGFDLVVKRAASVPVPNSDTRGSHRDTLVRSYRARMEPVYSDWEREPMFGVNHSVSSTVRFDEMYHPVRVQFSSFGSELSTPEHMRGLFGIRQALVLHGSGGAGKTTWLKWVFRSLFAGGEYIPILVVLRDLVRYWQSPDSIGEKQTLDEYLSQWGAAYAIDGWKAHWKELLASERSPKVVLLLDGWDEVGFLGNDLKTKLMGFLKQFPLVSIVVTSRSYGVGLPSETDGFAALRILPLSNEEIVAFSGRFYQFLYRQDPPRVSSIWHRFVDTLRDSPAALELARTPLLLTLMMQVGQSTVLPDKRHLLYEECVDRLVTAEPERKAKEGALLPKHQWAPADSEERRRVIAEAAAKSVSELGAVHARDELERRFPADWPRSQPGQTQRSLRRGFLAWLAGPAGLLTEDVDGLRFSHACLHEYLAARHYADSIEGTDARVKEFVARRRKVGEWEVLRLWAAILHGRNPDQAVALVRSLFSEGTPRQAQILAGTLLADGVGDETSFNMWRERVGGLSEWHNTTEVATCLQAWKTSRQQSWREAIAATLSSQAASMGLQHRLELEVMARAGGLTVDAPHRVDSPIVRCIIDELDRPCQSGSAWPVARRLLYTALRDYPWQVEEDANICLLNAFWPSRRVGLGAAMQVAVALGIPRSKINTLGFFDRNSARTKTGETFAYDLRAFLGGLVQAVESSGTRKHKDRQHFGAAMDDMIARMEPILDQPGVERNPIKNMRNYVGLLPSAMHFARERAFPGQTKGAFVKSVIDISNEQLQARYYHASPNAPWADDATLISAAYTSALLGRFEFMKPRGQSPVVTVFSFAYQAALEPDNPVAQARFALALHIPGFVDSFWSALARYIAGRATDEDRVLLMDSAMNPEKQPEPLCSMLRFVVRGDTPLGDGTILSLDEITHGLGIEPLPYLDEVALRQPDTALEEGKKQWKERFLKAGNMTKDAVSTIKKLRKRGSAK